MFYSIEEQTLVKEFKDIVELNPCVDDLSNDQDLWKIQWYYDDPKVSDPNLIKLDVNRVYF